LRSLSPGSSGRPFEGCGLARLLDALTTTISSTLRRIRKRVRSAWLGEGIEGSKYWPLPTNSFAVKLLPVKKQAGYRKSSPSNLSAMSEELTQYAPAPIERRNATTLWMRAGHSDRVCPTGLLTFHNIYGPGTPTLAGWSQARAQASAFFVTSCGGASWHGSFNI
jgi:hypothetical protein